MPATGQHTQRQHGPLCTPSVCSLFSPSLCRRRSLKRRPLPSWSTRRRASSDGRARESGRRRRLLLRWPMRPRCGTRETILEQRGTRIRRYLSGGACAGHVLILNGGVLSARARARLAHFDAFMHNVMRAHTCASVLPVTYCLLLHVRTCVRILVSGLPPGV